MRTRRRQGWIVIAALLAAAPPGPARGATEAELQSAVFRAKPAVVLIGVDATAGGDVDCGSGTRVAARLPPRPGSAAAPSSIQTAGS